MKMKNGIKGHVPLITVGLMAALCLGMLAYASGINAKGEDGSKATCTFVGSNPMFDGDLVTHEFTITWGTSADTVENISVPFYFQPEYIMTYQWDTMACYTDGEIFYFDEASYVPSAAIGTDSQGTINVYRTELKTNDGCESGAVCEFIFGTVIGSK